VQRPVAPGETFTERFVLTDAGTFWYHPQSNETVQMKRGLWGALIVRGADGPTIDPERVLVLDDLMLDRDGSIVPAAGRNSGMGEKARRASSEERPGPS